MENYLYSLLSDKPINEAKYKEENQRLRSNLGRLRKTLNHSQRVLLLRILDDKDLISEKCAQNYFADGFRLTSQIMVESLYLMPNGR